jgi:hypothetical protein
MRFWQVRVYALINSLRIRGVKAHYRDVVRRPRKKKAVEGTVAGGRSLYSFRKQDCVQRWRCTQSCFFNARLQIMGEVRSDCRTSY